jgi:hypothetical protein
MTFCEPLGTPGAPPFAGTVTAGCLTAIYPRLLRRMYQPAPPTVEAAPARIPAYKNMTACSSPCGFEAFGTTFNPRDGDDIRIAE